MNLTMWINIIDGQGPLSNGKLFTRQIETNFMPEPGIDDVILYITSFLLENSTTGPLWSVKCRYMDFNGNWHIVLSGIVVDPNECWRKNMITDLLRTNIYVYKSWYTQFDGDPTVELLRSGWEAR